MKGKETDKGWGEGPAVRAKNRLTAMSRQWLSPVRPLGARLACCVLAFCIGFPSIVTADEPSRNLLGGVGLIDIPSARMAPDGEISVGLGFAQNTQHYNLGFQALPWLETTFRYSGLTHFNPDFPVYYDRAFSAKARLWQETSVIPAVAIGVNDLVGTGIYGGEYIAASKQFGSFDATVGLGWGRLATANTFRNPLTFLSHSFTRRETFFGVAGQPEFNAWFHGPNAGVFGGLAWHTPIDNLALLAEISSDKYVQESSSGNFTPRSQLNFGLSYQFLDRTTLGLNWIYGRSIGASISLQLDPTHDSFPERLGAPMPPVHIRTPAEQLQALNSLLDERNIIPAYSNTANSALVSALWQDQRGVNDVAVSGTKLIVTVLPSSKLQCDELARVVAPIARDINTLELHTTSNRIVVVCAVKQQTPRTAQFSALQISPDVYRDRIVARSTEPIIIDASRPAGPSDAEAIAVIRAAAQKQNLIIQSIGISESEITVYYSNYKYFSEASALARLLRILLEFVPPSIEKFRLVAVVSGVPQKQFVILRTSAERDFDQTGTYSITHDGLPSTGAAMQNPLLDAQASYPNYSWSWFPQFRQELFDPDNPFAVQFLAGVEGVAELLPGLAIVGEAEVNLYDNFNVNRSPDSILPHVRTEWTKFFTKGKNGIGETELAYRFRLAPDLFATAKVGYLESMYAGTGAEVLWRPEGQRWALGADLYDVRERGFDRLFDLQSYHTVTGHISIYYDSPWYGLNFQLRAGQYLAGDRGITFQIARRFSGGIELGLFATKTNVSAAKFGEGSFDKGFFFRIPLSFAMPIETQNELYTIIRPVQRDGGQALDGDATLYSETERTSEGEMIRTESSPP